MILNFEIEEQLISPEELNTFESRFRKMILVIDIHYKNDYAKCVGVLFNMDEDNYSKKIEIYSYSH